MTTTATSTRPKKGPCACVPREVRQQLAIDVKAANGIQNFDKNSSQALDFLLNDPERKDTCGPRGGPLRLEIRNLTCSQWKLCQWNREKHFDKVHIPFVLGRAEKSTDEEEDKLATTTTTERPKPPTTSAPPPKPTPKPPPTPPTPTTPTPQAQTCSVD